MATRVLFPNYTLRSILKSAAEHEEVGQDATAMTNRPTTWQRALVPYNLTTQPLNAPTTLHPNNPQPYNPTP